MVRKRSWPAVSYEYIKIMNMVRHVTVRQRCGDPYPYAELDLLSLNLHLVYLKCTDGKPPAR